MLTYDNMIENTKKWVDLGRLNNNYWFFSAFRFDEIIVAHITNKPGAGIYMLTWDGENLEDHGIQIDLDLNGSTGLFIPKDDTKCESVFIGETPQRDTDVEGEVIFDQRCDIRNNNAYVMKFEVECDFDKTTGGRSYFFGTQDANYPFRLDTVSNMFHLYLPITGFETAEFFVDDFLDNGNLFFHEGFCTTGEYVEFVMKQVVYDPSAHKIANFSGQTM